jgi:hypothetical protein
VKYGLLSYFYSDNLGDEIQSIAAARHLPRVDLLLERDRLHWYRRSSPITALFNGWFTRPASPACWPPPPSVRPIFLSWYAECPDALINQHTADYFRHFGPIGCRSVTTVDHFARFGIPAYFSGCLTLTLPPAREERSDDICLVDVEPELLHTMVPDRIRARARTLTHSTPSAHMFPPNMPSVLHSYLRTFNLLDRGLEMLRSHRERLLYLRHHARTKMAQSLLDTYSKAKLVITGRLHCAMPCLALDTPVVLLRPDLETNSRFRGLVELVRYRSSGVTPPKINWDRPEPNGDAHHKLARDLESACRTALERTP